MFKSCSILLLPMKLRIRGVELRLSFSLLCLMALCAALGVAHDFFFCASAVTVHELGHLAVMLHYGDKPSKIRVSLCEIAIDDPNRAGRTDRQNFFIIFFGPFVNFICFLPCFLLYLCGNDFFLSLAAANLSVGLFNLLPVMSLDGGQLLYLLLSKRTGAQRAERAVNVLSFLILFPLAALGFLVLFRSKYNFSLFMVCGYIIFSLICRKSQVF